MFLSFFRLRSREHHYDLARDNIALVLSKGDNSPSQEKKCFTLLLSVILQETVLPCFYLNQSFRCFTFIEFRGQSICWLQ